MKVLPPAPWETLEEVYVDNPRLRNRRFPVKVMFMGIVGRPTDTCDGKIFLKRVSNIKESERLSHHQNFSDNFITNHLIKSGEWKRLFNPDDVSTMDVEDLFDMIGEYYGLEHHVVENLCLSFSSHTCTGRTVKAERYQEGPVLEDRFYVDDTGTVHPLYFDQVQLVV